MFFFHRVEMKSPSSRQLTLEFVLITRAAERSTNDVDKITVFCAIACSRICESCIQNEINFEIETEKCTQSAEYEVAKDHFIQFESFFGSRSERGKEKWICGAMALGK